MASNWKDSDRLNRHARGYGYQWTRYTRPAVLKRDHYLCKLCETRGRITPANHVDHIKPKSQGGTDSLDNLQALCEPCHKAKTAHERNGGALPGCDDNGLPIDTTHHWHK